MCDFSLHAVKSRPAKVGDKLRTHNFATGTRGFAALEDADLAICLLPGTELSFEREALCFNYRQGHSCQSCSTSPPRLIYQPK